MSKTTLARTARHEAAWFVVDASRETLGRMASRVARILQGKHKPTYTPHADQGDFVVVVNSATVGVSGTKARDKVYRRHTGYPGGLRETSWPRMKARHPEEMVRQAVKRMMPKSTLGRHMLRKLKIYPGAQHPHHAQDPQPLSFGTGRKSKGA
jgi:large subunit ribosomal protein L13